VNSREIALIIVFVALTVALDPIRIPSGYLLGVSYRFSEIPILAAFLLFGPKVGVLVALLNVPAEIMLFPVPSTIIGVPFVFMLTMSMLFGIYLASGYMKRKTSQNPTFKTKPIKYFTAFGALFRTSIAPFIIAFDYRFMLPIVGFHLSEKIILGLMPAFALYAFTFSLYTIPIGYLIARTVSRNLKIDTRL
jgi:riboflavin transporter FmnP